MKLILIRHGQTEENVAGICQGQQPGHLTTKGIEQAKKLGERFKDETFDVMYCSDLQRTIDTASEIMTYHPNTEMILDKRLRERTMGEMDGHKFTKNFDWNSLPKGAESREALYNRVKEFFKEIVDKHINETVLVVAHGGTKRAFYTILHDLPFGELHRWGEFQNTSVSIFEIGENGNHRLVLKNCAAHLDE